MRIYITIGLVWIACGLIGAGLFNGVDQNKRNAGWLYEDNCLKWAARDQSFAIIIGTITGPIGLLPILAFTGFGYDGWRLSRKECHF